MKNLSQTTSPFTVQSRTLNSKQLERVDDDGYPLVDETRVPSSL